MVRTRDPHAPHTSSPSLRERAQDGAPRGPAALILDLQRGPGNAALARSLLQRQEEEPERGPGVIEQDEAVPGIRADVAEEVREHIRRRRRQAALDVLVAHLIETNQIDGSLLRSQRMFFSSAVSGEGAVMPPGFRTDPDTGQRVARPSRVRIGPAAFRQDLTWLYTSVLHEYTHVLQFQQTNREGGPTSGQGPQQWLIERQEMEAYAQEILDSHRTGMFNNARQMRETWRRLHREHWINIGPKGKRALNDLYIQAHDIAQEAVGPDVVLPFRPLPPEAAAAAPAGGEAGTAAVTAQGDDAADAAAAAQEAAEERDEALEAATA